MLSLHLLVLSFHLLVLPLSKVTGLFLYCDGFVLYSWKAKAAEAELLKRTEAEMAAKHMRELEVSTWRGWILSKAKSALGLFGSIGPIK
jgi:hypothetical protein